MGIFGKKAKEFFDDLFLSNEEKIRRNKAQFYKDIDPFIKESLVTILLETKTVTFVNACDFLYGAAFYSRIPNGPDQVLISVNADMIRYSRESETLFWDVFRNYSLKEKNELTFILGPSNLEIMRNIREETRITGPASMIDYELEYELGVRERPKQE